MPRNQLLCPGTREWLGFWNGQKGMAVNAFLEVAKKELHGRSQFFVED